MRVTDKYVFFCKGILGNWAKTPLKYKELNFFSSEQLFMFMKAELFDDLATAFKIVNATTSKEAKDLGRQIKNFNQEVWDENKFEVMKNALVEKLFQCAEFKETLKKYSDKIFVECNPEDHIWAIGLDEDDDRILDEKNWNGENLLGAVLTSLAHPLKSD